jgi:PadR family transcriptional regulator PadR
VENSQLLKGVLPVAVLARVAAGDTHGYSILRSLRGGGFESVGDASVYGTLQRLYADGLLSTHLEPSERGPSRKCYALTADGRARLTHEVTRWRRFADAVDNVVRTERGMRS